VIRIKGQVKIRSQIKAKSKPNQSQIKAKSNDSKKKINSFELDKSQPDPTRSPSPTQQYASKTRQSNQPDSPFFKISQSPFPWT
jgi:hypothetical protein